MLPPRAGRVRIPVVAMLIAMASCCGDRGKDATGAPVDGHKLMDLDEARRKGLITEKEYNLERRKILMDDGRRR